MDRVIENRKRPVWTFLSLSVFGLLLLLALVYAFFKGGVSSVSVSKDAIQTAEVEYGVFEDAIPLRVMFEPDKTIFIDTVQGGSVVEMFVEEGAMVEAGETLMRLDNVNFKLQVASQEALIAEQLNTNSSVRLQLDQNRFELQRSLNEVEYTIVRLERQLLRHESLAREELVAYRIVDELKDELKYQTSQRELLKENIASEEKIRVLKLRQLEESTDRLEEHSRNIRETLEALWVRSPMKGQLTSFPRDIGEILPEGSRVGQIDSVDRFKLEAQVDEFYVGRVEVGQEAKFELGGKSYVVKVDKVFPQVVSGKFIINLFFTENMLPPEARPGLRVSAELMLANTAPGLIVKNGNFVQSTAGKWAFVLSSDGSKAIKRNIEIGRVGINAVEIKSGLREGEDIIISDYDEWKNIDEVKFRK